MLIQFYSFPMEDDGLVAIERAVKELEEKQKAGDNLEQEEIDWLEYAENILYQR